MIAHTTPLTNDERRALWAVRFYGAGFHRQSPELQQRMEDAAARRYAEEEAAIARAMEQEGNDEDCTDLG